MTPQAHPADVPGRRSAAGRRWAVTALSVAAVATVLLLVASQWQATLQQDRLVGTSAVAQAQPSFRPDPVVPVTAVQDNLRRLMACMRSKGFDVQELPGGGYQVGAPPDARAALNAGQAECKRGLGIADARRPGLPEPAPAAP